MRGFAVVAALAAATLLPGERLGIAVPLIAVLVVAAAAPALRASTLRLSFAVLALALAAQAALLDATWIVAIDLCAAWVLAALAASGPALAAVIAPIVRLREAPALAPRPSTRQAPALRGVLLGAVVVLPFLLLFLSADAAFAGLVGDLPLPDGGSIPARLALLLLVLVASLGLGLAARNELARRDEPTSRRLSFPEWAIPLALLDLLFAVFVVVQLAVLFGGHDRVLRTTGLTYAEYARSGFWQLLTAAALTFAVVGGALRYSRPRSRRETVVQRVLLSGLCTLTVVVLVSAFERLRLYEDTFGLTRPRLLAEAVAVWLGVLLVLVAAAVWSWRARSQLGAVATLVTAAGLLAFSIGDPDRRVAERNVERWRATGDLDVGYVELLSADAAPALVELPEPERTRVTTLMRQRLADDDSWSSANRSRIRARELLGG